MSRRTATTTAIAILTVVAIVILNPAPGLAKQKRVVVQGRVLDESGAALPGWPVLLLATQRYLEIGKFSSGGGVLTAARATSDRNGYYEIDVPKERGYQYWFVRFVDPETFDSVKYLPAPDVEVSSQVRKGLVSQVDVTVRLHPDWPEIERRLALVGGVSTPKGKVLRALGLPEKSVQTDSSALEEWWYFTKGVVYSFRGEEAAGSRRFDPVKAPDEARRASGG